MKSNGIAVSPPDRAERPGARDYGTKRCLILLQRHDRLPRRPARRKECVQPRTAQTATLRAGQRHCPCSCECIGGPHAKAVKCSEVLFDACRSRSFKIDCRARVVYCRPVTCEHFQTALHPRNLRTAADPPVLTAHTSVASNEFNSGPTSLDHS